MSNLILKKTTTAIFLAIVLIAGTFAAISPSSFITGVNAQSEPYYEMDDRYNDYKQGYGMDNSYDDRKSYGMDNSYGYSDYRDDKDRKYDSYGYPEYRMDKDKKSYGSDSYKSQYSSSYKQDYKPKYQSYGKDDKRDKSKDSKVDIKKIKCFNTNLNINGNNTADINVGNKGSAEGYSGAYSSGVNGKGYNGYYDGYDNKQGKGFDDCVINNNNNNTNINVGVGDGNQTIPEDLACEECFAVNSTLQTAIEDRIAEFNTNTLVGRLTTDGVNEIGESFAFAPQIDTIEKLCAQIENAPVSLSIGAPLSDELIRGAFISLLGTDFESGIEQLVNCLLEKGIIVDRELSP